MSRRSGGAVTSGTATNTAFGSPEGGAVLQKLYDFPSHFLGDTGSDGGIAALASVRHSASVRPAAGSDRHGSSSRLQPVLADSVWVGRCLSAVGAVEPGPLPETVTGTERQVLPRLRLSRCRFFRLAGRFLDQNRRSGDNVETGSIAAGGSKGDAQRLPLPLGGATDRIQLRLELGT